MDNPATVESFTVTLKAVALPTADGGKQTWPSTAACIARLVIHRDAMLGVLDEEGQPLQALGILAAPKAKGLLALDSGACASPAVGAGLASMAGKVCPECGKHTLIHKDACEFCTACSFVGQCG